MGYPKKIFHWIGNKEIKSKNKFFLKKYNPATGGALAKVASGDWHDVKRAVDLAERAFIKWSQLPVLKRAQILRRATFLLQKKKDEIADIIALESGKPKKYAVGEAGAAVKCGLFLVDQLNQFGPEKMISGVPNRKLKLIRQSIGVGALITPFNNPMAGIAWKAFPALLCGNAVVVKSHELTPYVAVWFGKILKEAGLPAGVFNVIQGLGADVGVPLVKNSKIKFISFTGSAGVGSEILKTTADRLAKVSIEAGGKNPFVVCDDADLEKAADLAVASAFIDAGQRCAAASRIIIFSNIYEKFKKLFLEKTNKLKIGIGDSDDYGVIISGQRLGEILNMVNGAVRRRAILLAGGFRLKDKKYNKGYFMAPTVLEKISPKDMISRKEIFGPVAILYKAKNFEDALKIANDSDFKLSGAIHTKNIKRAKEFADRYFAGVVRVNGPTYGSEPHVPFGGVGLSGNGWREPGIKALDFYSDWKQISID